MATFKIGAISWQARLRAGNDVLKETMANCAYPARTVGRIPLFSVTRLSEIEVASDVGDLISG